MRGKRAGGGTCQGSPREVPLGWAGLYLVLGFLLGFSVAMVLVGDSPWSEFWLQVARIRSRG